MCLDQVTAPIDTALVMPESKEVQIVCSGMTKFEKTSDKYLSGRGMAAKVKREYTFPNEIVKAALAFNVKFATATSDQDKRRIMSFICGRPLDEDPPREHERYER